MLPQELKTPHRVPLVQLAVQSQRHQQQRLSPPPEQPEPAESDERPPPDQIPSAAEPSVLQAVQPVGQLRQLPAEDARIPAEQLVLRLASQAVLAS